MEKMDKSDVLMYVYVGGLMLCLLCAAIFSAVSFAYLYSGRHLAKANVQFVVSSDAPWETFPPFMKEYISKKATLDTKLDLKDLKEIRAWYDDQIKKYKNPIILRIEPTYPKKEGK